MAGPYTITTPVQGQPIPSVGFGLAVKNAITDLDARTSALEGVQQLVIARGRRITNSTATSGTTEQGVLRIDGIPLKTGRVYRFSTGSILVDGSVASDICRLSLRVNNAGVATTSSTQLTIAQATVPNISFPECLQVDVSYTPVSDETLSVLISIVRVNGTGVFQTVGGSTTPTDLYINDCGIDPGDTGVDI